MRCCLVGVFPPANDRTGNVSDATREVANQAGPATAAAVVVVAAIVRLTPRVAPVWRLAPTSRC